MHKRLSILVCSTEERKGCFQNLARVLKAQSNSYVELLANIDNGLKTIGAKRNELLESAKGDYVCFVDDDDMLSPFYTSKILEAIKTNPDCCGLEGIITFSCKYPKKFIHSLRYDHWFEKEDIYYRCPNHLNTIKREIALDTKFPDKSWQEDLDFSTRLKGKLKTEVYIDEPIYYYYPSKGF
jgi:glycosyltransferase involved in cell wall biosynthesis